MKNRSSAHAFVALLAVSVLGIWLLLCQDPFDNIRQYWPVTVTMIFGSLIAGATSDDADDNTTNDGDAYGRLFVFYGAKSSQYPVYHYKEKNSSNDHQIVITWEGNSSVDCDNNTAYLDIYNFNTLKVCYRNKGLKKMNGPHRIGRYTDLGRRLVDNFLETIKGKSEPLINGSDVRDSIWCVEECYHKAKRFNLPWYEKAEKING